MTNNSPKTRYVKDYNLFADENGLITYGDGNPYPTFEIGGFLYIKPANSVCSNYIPVHEIIAKAFLEEDDSTNSIVIHKNGNFKDNASANLQRIKADTALASNEIDAFRRSLANLNQIHTVTTNSGDPIQSYHFYTAQEIGSNLGYSTKYQCYATLDGRVFEKKGNDTYVLNKPRYHHGSYCVTILFKEEARRTDITISKIVLDAFNNEYHQHPSEYSIVYRDGNVRNVKFENLTLKPIKNPLITLSGNRPKGKDLKKVRNLNLYVGRNGTLWRLKNDEYIQVKVKQSGTRFYAIYCKNKRITTRPLAELVATYFIEGFDKNIHTIEFKDGNTLNCAADNLRIVPVVSIPYTSPAITANGDECIPVLRPNRKNITIHTVFLTSFVSIFACALLIVSLVTLGGR